MKNHKLFYLLILFTLSSCAQEKGTINVIGTWEMLEMVSTQETEIDIGELVINGEDPSVTDSINKVIQKIQKEDPRLTKWYYIFDKDKMLEFRLGIGGKFKSKIDKNYIYRFGKPFYKIVSIKNDTLTIKEIHNDKTLIMKRVNVNLGGLKIITD